MRKTVVAAALGAMVAGGCADETPPPPRAVVPPVNTYTTVAEAPPKPLPPQDPGLLTRSPYLDEPLLSVAPPPEEAAFVATYDHVGRPRVALFVNRTLGGNLIETTHGQRFATVDETRTATGAVTADSGAPLYDGWGRPVTGSYDHFQTGGPAQLHDRTEVYLAPGEYDELSARRVDYDAIESVLGDWLHANGRVTLVSPALSEGQTKALQDGRTAPLGDLSKNQQVDVLVQVQAKATKQTQQGLAVRLIAEAIDTASGESLGRAFVDVPPPLEKPVINEYTRFLARKLMSDMTQTWNSPRPAAANASPQSLPTPPSPPTAAPAPAVPPPATMPSTVP